MKTALLVFNLLLIVGFFGQVFLRPSTSQECSFWPGSIYNRGYCYGIISNEMTWEEAKDACSAISPSRRLAELKTERAAQAVINFAILKDDGAFNSRPSIWIGGRYDKTRKVPEWISTKEEVTNLAGYRWMKKGEVPSDGNECLSLAGDMRPLSFQSCSTKTVSICEEYVGNPCTEFNETSSYINGTCFSLIKQKQNWDGAKEFCEKNKMKLAEPTMSQIDFIVEYVIRQMEYKIMAVPQGISAVLYPYKRIWTEFAFLSRSCGDVSITLTECTTNDPNIIGVLNVKMNSDKTRSAEECEKSAKTNEISACTEVRQDDSGSDGRQMRDDACERLRKVYRSRSKGLQLDYAYDFIPGENRCRSFRTDRITFKTSDDYPGEILIKTERIDAYIGARRDLQKGGEYKWETSGTLVDFPRRYWFPGAPTAMNLEAHLGLSYLGNKLYNMNGVKKKCWFICQKDVRLLSHVAVVPRDQRDHDLQITTSSMETVMIQGALLDKSGSQMPVDELRTAVTIDHPRTFDIGSVLSSYDSDTPEAVLLIQSTKEITVITYSQTPSEPLFGQTVYPSDVHSFQYLVYPSNGEVKSFKTLIVAIQEGKTAVKVISEKETDEHVLRRYERISSTSRVTNASVLVVADKNVAVFTVVHLEGYSGPVVFPHQPLDALTDSYITIPSLPIDPNSKKADEYVVVAAYANTTVESTDPNMKGLSVLNEGDLATVTIPSNGFYYIHAEQLFYLWKKETTGSCTMPMIPSSMWKTNFNFVVSMGLASRSSAIYIVAVYTDNAKDSPLLNGKPLADLDCQSIRKTGDFKACHFKVNQGSYDLRLTSGDREFMAYLYGTQNGQSFCHPLGVKGPKEVKEIAYNWETYRKNLKKPKPSDEKKSGVIKPSRSSLAHNEICKEFVSVFSAANIPLSKLDHPAFRRFLQNYVINGGPLPSSKQLQECYLLRELDDKKELGQKAVLGLDLKVANMLLGTGESP